MQTTTDTTEEKSAPAARVHLVGDLLMIALFVILGMSEHRSIASFVAVVRNLVIFGGAWSLCAWLFKLYRSPAAEKAVSSRLAATWAVAITAGIVVRGILLGRSFGRGQLLFWTVAMAATGAFLFGWRLAYAGVRAMTRKTKSNRT